jgi:hypothetical protein
VLRQTEARGSVAAGILIGALIGFAIIGVLLEFDIGSTPEERELRAFIGEKYNFTEGECVEWITPQWNITTVDYWDCGSQPFVLVREWQCRHVVEVETVPGCEECSRYCRTAQIPTGEEECRTEEFIGVRAEQECSVSIDRRPYAIPFIYETTFNTSCGEYTFTLSEPYNVTTCAPIYKTERTFCATSEEIARARELVK